MELEKKVYLPGLSMRQFSKAAEVINSLTQPALSIAIKK